MKKLLLASALALSLTSCLATDYKFGDISKTYCASTSPEFRFVIRDQLESMGIVVTPNYCATVGLIDAMSKLTGS